ncbi:MAG: TetR/AcrR family transcriptional regulator [Myxococcota bacterium]|jgi:AcrR family transcriptional regulator|nr:TetR/AcrR family transcriptional regulator [Myxococcota bacterium]
MNSEYLLKEPAQERSRQTVQALIEATELILVEDGWDKITTNHVAERAGVSIGTLYQYFANKEALIGLLLEQYIEEQFTELATRLADAVSFDMTLQEAVPHIIHAMLEAKMVRPELSRALFTQAPYFGQVELLDAWNSQAEPMVSAALAARASEVRDMDTDMAAYILNNAMHGIIHATVLSRPELLDSKELADEICELVLRYLQA